MARLREWIDRLLGTLRARRADADLRGRAAVAPGFAAEAGRDAIRRGDAGHGRLRDRRGLPWLHALPPTSSFGWRQLASRPVVSRAAVLSLGLAIGATSAAFRLVDAVLLRPLPVAAPGPPLRRVTWLRGRPAAAWTTTTDWDYPTYRR